MNVYEAIIILNSEIIDNAKYVLYEELKLLENNILYTKVEEWGEKRLAYPIRTHTKGYYFVITFACENEEIINQLNFNLQILQDCNYEYVLKYIIVKQDYEVQKENICSNVLGKEFKILQVNKEVENKVSEKNICSECGRENEYIEVNNEIKYFYHVWAKIDNNYSERLICIAENVCKECLEKILQEKNLTMSDIYDYSEDGIISFEWHGEKFYYYDYSYAHFDNFYECEQCGEWINTEFDSDIVETEDYIFCSSDCAYDYGYEQCDDCGTWVYRNSYGFTTHDGRFICEECYENYYFTCQCCDEIYHTDDSCYVDEEDEYICYNCYNQSLERKRRVCNYHYYKGNYWKEKKYNENTHVNLFGIELEVENKKQLITNNEVVEKICDIDKEEVFVFENDSSLNSGFEIISNPCSLNYWYSKENELKEIFEKLSNSGFSSHDTTTCGLHIHFSRDYVDSEIIGRILYLFEKFKNNLVMFSRRKIDSLNRWASFMNVDFKELSLDYVKSNQDDCNRYKAVNLTNNKTIEIRIFKGTLKFESFMACIELVNNIVEMAKNMNDNEIINVESFYNVIEYQKTKYLKQYCLDRRIVENVNNIECEG